jgi:16S rRNA processing protein RimM
VSAQHRLVPVAEVARPHGVRGELRLRVFNQGSDMLLKKPPVRLRLASGEEKPTEILAARATNGAVLVMLAGVSDRNGAEALRGATMLVARDRFPPLDDGEFYACDLEGARAISSGKDIGHVEGIVTYPTCDVLLVIKDGGARLEVPLIDNFVKRVDVAAGIVELEGLDELP